MTPTTISLRDLLDKGSVWSVSQVRRSLSSFDCLRNHDVTDFLKRYAVNNERNGSSRSYLVCDEDSLADGELVVIAFFTLALSVIDYSSIEIPERREIMGNVPGYRTLSSFPGYLVAQLARDDAYGPDDVSGTDMLIQAEWILRDASDTVGGRLIYLDCRDELVGYYEKLGYRELYLNESTGLHKMFKSMVPASASTVQTES